MAILARGRRMRSGWSRLTSSAARRRQCQCATSTTRSSPAATTSRIIRSSTAAAPQRGDIIRLVYGFSVPANGRWHAPLLATLRTHSARDVSQALRRAPFHEPFLPFLSLVLLRESQSITSPRSCTAGEPGLRLQRMLLASRDGHFRIASARRPTLHHRYFQATTVTPTASTSAFATAGRYALQRTPHLLRGPFGAARA